MIRNGVAAVITFFLLSCSAARAQTNGTHPRWALHWFSGKGDFYDQPVCRSLQTFNNRLDAKENVDSERIGEIAGFVIYSVIHTSQEYDDVTKMILVERKPNEFCEIFQQEYPTGTVTAKPAFIVNVGSQTVLATHDQVSGTGGYWLEAYWTFDKGGPIPLDLDIVDDTIHSLMNPEDRTYRAYLFDVKRLSAQGYGHIFVQFALVDHQLKVVSKTK